jgi:hypothetical protein
MSDKPKCMICGGGYGRHQAGTMRCPLGGREASPQRDQIWLDTAYLPDCDECQGESAELIRKGQDLAVAYGKCLIDLHAKETALKVAERCVEENEELKAERDRLREALKDPALVWTAMLREKIARQRALDHYEECKARVCELEVKLSELRAERDRLREALDYARETLGGIYAANWRSWESPCNSIEDFEKWAKSRAEYALKKLDAALSAYRPEPAKDTHGEMIKRGYTREEKS